MLSAILIGNNIVNLSASALSATLTTKLFGSAYIGAATGILTFLVLVFGEVTPKSLATIYSLKLSLVYSGIIRVLMVVLVPFIFIIDGIRKGILKILHIDPDAKARSMTEDELKTLVDVAMEEDAIEEDDRQHHARVAGRPFTGNAQAHEQAGQAQGNQRFPQRQLEMVQIEPTQHEIDHPDDE